MAADIVDVTTSTTPKVLYKCRVPSGVTFYWSTAGNSGEIYLGGPNVATHSYALYLDKKASGTFFIPYGETVYCVSAAGGDTVHGGCWV